MLASQASINIELFSINKMVYVRVISIEYTITEPVAFGFLFNFYFNHELNYN